ncbi:MAG: hypothetical protein IT370_28530 [Deltaproteobacteria bacterium]|nr:hypothetical protein [Deltaproteobacteria bacterium]
MCSRSRSGLVVALLALVLAGCSGSVDLEIDLRRADGSIWLSDTRGERRQVDFCMVPDGVVDAGPGDAGVMSGDCVIGKDNADSIFLTGERDSIGLFVAKERALRLFFLAYQPAQCWVIDLPAPVRGHLTVRLPVGAGALGVEGCAPPRCWIVPCETPRLP